MRQVEYDVTSAIRGKRNVGCNNTSVVFNAKATKGYVVLHGNLIATIDYTKKRVKLFDGGFQSNVTKSRLNCVLNALNIRGSIVTRQKVFRYEEREGVFQPFKSGMVLSF